MGYCRLRGGIVQHRNARERNGSRFSDSSGGYRRDSGRRLNSRCFHCGCFHGSHGSCFHRSRDRSSILGGRFHCGLLGGRFHCGVIGGCFHCRFCGWLDRSFIHGGRFHSRLLGGCFHGSVIGGSLSSGINRSGLDRGGINLWITCLHGGDYGHLFWKLQLCDQCSD